VERGLDPQPVGVGEAESGLVLGDDARAQPDPGGARGRRRDPGGELEGVRTGRPGVVEEHDVGQLLRGQRVLQDGPDLPVERDDDRFAGPGGAGENGDERRAEHRGVLVGDPTMHQTGHRHTRMVAITFPDPVTLAPLSGSAARVRP
jgi:hypothetical protein